MVFGMKEVECLIVFFCNEVGVMLDGLLVVEVVVFEMVLNMVEYYFLLKDLSKFVYMLRGYWVGDMGWIIEF